MYHRVTIDLSQHFSNYKKKCAILLRDKWTTVKDLQTYIKEIFKLKKIEFTDANNVYIPASESIDIIKKDGLVDLIGVGIKSKKSEEINRNDEDYTNGNNTYNNIINVLNSTRKRSILNSGCDNNYITDNRNHLTYNPSSSSEMLTPVKRKRKRNKINKKSKENSFNEKSNLSVNTATINLPITELPKHHVRFDEFGNSVTSLELEQNKINFRNLLDTQNSTKARIIRTIVVQNTQQNQENIIDDTINENASHEKFPENNVIVTENKIINNGFELLRNALYQEQSKTNVNSKIMDEQNIESDDDVVNVKYVENSDENLHAIFQHEDKIIKHQRIYSISESIKCQPEIEDIIFFKIYVREHCLTDYICGKLECIIELDNINYLKIYIIAGQAELRNQQQTILDFHDDNDVKLEYLKIKFSDLYEPRILKCNLKNST